jgi:hypothetical protein
MIKENAPKKKKYGKKKYVLFLGFFWCGIMKI